MKTNLDIDYKTNEDLEKNGVNMALNKDVSFRVRRFNSSNPRVKAAMATYYKPYARLIEMGTMPPEKAEELNIRLFIDVCLVSWEGLTDENGEPIPFSKEKAFDVLKSLPDVFATLWKNANDFANFKEELGNS